MKTECRYFMDSSAWLDYFDGNDKKVKKIVEENNIKVTSVLSLFEIKRKLLRDKTDNEVVERILECIQRRSLLADLTETICNEAVKLSLKHKLPAIDALIYGSSKKYNCVLVTSDSDFDGCSDVTLLR